MVVLVKLKIEVNGREQVTNALLNSGFGADGPDLVIPVGLARRLGIWPPSKARVEEAISAGGIIQVYTLESKGKLKLLVDDQIKAESECNFIIDPHASEVLVSDYLIDELGISILSFRKGYWRHKTDPEGVVRKSEQPQYWS